MYRALVVVIDASFRALTNVLTSLGVLELGQQSYLIVLLCASPAESCIGDAFGLIKSSKIVVLSPLVPNWNAIQDKFKMVLSGPMGIQTDRMMVYWTTYNACFTYCSVANRAGVGDGTSFASYVRGKSFVSRDGLFNLTFDQGPALLQSYTFQWVPMDADNLTVAYIANPTPRPCQNLSCITMALAPGDTRVWAVERSQNISACFYMGGCTNYLPIVLSVCGVLLVVAASAFIYVYQRRKRLDVYRMHWRIPKQQLKVIENKQSKGKTSSAPAETLSSKRRVIQAYALIGTSKSEFIAVKQLRKIRWDKHELRFIFELKRVNHDNITAFLGITYNEADRFYLCHNLIERASLEDFVNDQDFNMDATFKSAFLRDTLKGVQYLHKSAIGYHGLLTLGNCLIDANWVLKLTNFGITNMLHKAIEREQLKLIEIIPLSTYYYIAPEHLTDVALGKTYPKGNAVGDIYSFGMMLYQILFRVGPFERTNLTPKEIIEEVKRKGLKPIVENTIPEERPLVDVMEQCWQRNPDLRPKLKQLNQVIATAFESSKGNLVDQMIRMNEKYAQNLEQVVAERSTMLQEAQEQTDRLLCEMIPPSIAEKLKQGQPIEPRSYDAATVLFCQLVDFSIFLTKSSPDQVIMFLNDVFTMFDHIISQHDAYKVETTGETYMVASGVPNENGDRHVFEISDIALQLRESTYVYRVPQRPDWKLQVRIGYHCGPIAAGVIGIKAPRYCLFGDTVNFASRMQSNCPPNQIQLSEQTALMLKATPQYKLTKRGIVRVKGKGDVNTYWLNEHAHEHGQESDASAADVEKLDPALVAAAAADPPSARSGSGSGSKGRPSSKLKDAKSDEEPSTSSARAASPDGPLASRSEDAMGNTAPQPPLHQL
ncbi:Protein GCY-27 a [Aphelenchoides avenae]|nr:Protein GCY-27 a [Aphelenchus avenae]